MNTKKGILLLIVLLVTVLGIIAFFRYTPTFGNGQGGRGGGADLARMNISAMELQDVSDAEREGLQLMREEEKLARDVYKTLYSTWNARPFLNISESEQMHTDAVKSLLDRYAISDPVSDDTVGAFTNPLFAGLYTELTQKGSVSLVEAFRIGALIEELDIHDLQEKMPYVDNEDIAFVYENLERGSRNHLRTYVSQLQSQGEVYVPQYLSQESFNEIVSTPKETGMNGGRGRGTW